MDEGKNFKFERIGMVVRNLKATNGIEIRDEISELESGFELKPSTIYLVDINYKRYHFFMFIK